ncbi:MAG: hypothetical protein ABIG11_09865 [bacterium]
MQILNYYFSPFAAILIGFALYFSGPDRKTMWFSAGVLLAVTVFNHWFLKNAYRFLQWTKIIREVLVCLNLLASAALFFLLGAYWAPMWLLFLIAPATGAMFMSRSGTMAIAVSAAGSMLLIYYVKSAWLGLQLGEVQWGMASTHAVFVIVFSLFVHAMAQMALRIRDASR